MDPITNYFTFSALLPACDSSQCESEELRIRMRVMMRLNQLRNDSRLSWQDQCSIASLAGALMVHYGISGGTKLDAHLFAPEVK